MPSTSSMPLVPLAFRRGGIILLPLAAPAVTTAAFCSVPPNKINAASPDRLAPVHRGHQRRRRATPLTKTVATSLPLLADDDMSDADNIGDDDDDDKSDDPLLTPIPKCAYEGMDLPTTFAYPHCYDPHPVAKFAADELREQLATMPSSSRPAPGDDYDDATTSQLDDDGGGDENGVGKMMGVLVVRYDDNGDGSHGRDESTRKAEGMEQQQQQQQQRLGYLKAYSGTLSSGTALSIDDGGRFCPPLYDRSDPDGFYRRGEEELNELNRSVERMERDPERRRRRDALAAVVASCGERWSAARAHSKRMKEERRSRRESQRPVLTDAEYEALDEELKQEGAAIQRRLKALRARLRAETEEAEAAAGEIERGLRDLKDERATRSRELQDELFRRYSFLNARGEERSLLPMFADAPPGRPPSGAGDCAAPKLLQHAFSRGYTPVAMAEFWWGRSPANEVRRHGLYYPACRGKCQPILEHMLSGMDVKSNPMDDTPPPPVVGDDAANRERRRDELEVLYEDEHIAVVNKPGGVLSAPGRALEHSVHSVMKARHPNATGPLLVHRLDMSTSGVLCVAKDKDTHKALSRQFIDRTVQKRYVALLEGELDESKGKKGKIDLPLAPDYINRPMQMVSEKEGKPAQTVYEVVEVANGRTRVNFYPLTGRTHQLRVHAAHSRGLDCPIVGDDIYGARDERLCLHAEYLALTHPVTKERLTFTAAPTF